MTRLSRYFLPDQPLKKSTLTPIPLDVAADVSTDRQKKKRLRRGNSGAA
jgi:hypothetical protein